MATAPLMREAIRITSTVSLMNRTEPRQEYIQKCALMNGKILLKDLEEEGVAAIHPNRAGGSSAIHLPINPNIFLGGGPMLLFWVVFFVSERPDTFRLEITPFNFQDERNPTTFITGIHQLECSNDVLHVLPANEARILQFNRNGRFLASIGKKGGGPGEISDGAFAMAIDGPAIWILTGGAKKAMYYEKGEFALEIQLQGYNIQRHSQTANAFTFNNRYLLVPTFPGTRKLANAYTYDGLIHRQIGSILPVDSELLQKNPALNDTMWQRYGNSWFCLFKFQPLLLEFNADFKEINRFELQGPEIDEMNDALAEHVPNKKFHYPRAHFTDFKLFRENAYLLCEGVLYQIDLNNGETLTRTRFFGTGDTFSFLEPGVDLFLFYISFFSDGTLVLAHPAMPWDHDMWQTRLPFLEPLP